MKHVAYFPSPLGLLEITGDEEGVSGLRFTDVRSHASNRIHESLRECVYQLEEYFSGIRKDFGIRLNPQGTEFQQRVWKAVSEIPFGRTSTYGEIARQLGDPRSVRAVGTANGSNPVLLLIPCHRVIGSDGSMTGYNGGLHRKDWLLTHEKNIVFGQQTSLFTS